MRLSPQGPLLLFLISGALVAESHAQEVIVADRPGLGTGSSVVGGNILQFEMGAESASLGNTKQYSFGQLLLRLGLSDRVEIRGLGNSLVVSRGDGPDREGIEDLTLGVKLNFLSNDSRNATISFLGEMAFPSGDEGFTQGETVPTAALLSDISLSESVGLGANLGVTGFAADVEEQVFVTLTPSMSLPGESAVSVYGGYAGFFADSDDLHYAEAGLTWLVSSDLQLDVNGGVELQSGDGFVGLGLATRWFPGGR